MKFFLPILLIFLVTIPAAADHTVLLQGNDRLAVVNPDGTIEWETPWGGLHDCHVLENGNFLVLRGRAEVCEIDRHTKKIVWSYDASKANGNEGKNVEVHACQPLENNRVMITETTTQRIIEVDREGKIQKEIVWQLHQHDLPGITLAWVTTLEVLPNGNYVIGNCHAGPNNPLLIEIDPPTKEVVWTLDRFKDFGNSVSNSKVL